jgi:predicted TIM-barrel fold metal-dependent hydrolase
MDAAGVDAAVLVPPSWEGERNDLVLAAAKTWPTRFAAVGRISDDASGDDLRQIGRLPGMLALRVILSDQTAWVRQGAFHPLWEAAASSGVPLMVAAANHFDVISEVLKTFPTLRIVFDHCATTYRTPSTFPWWDFEDVVKLAKSPNIAVKLTALPCISRQGYPWTDVTPYIRRLYDAFGSERLFWGSDLSRLPCPYTQLVEFFMTGIPWLTPRDRDLIMGDALRAWLGWR